MSDKIRNKLLLRLLVAGLFSTILIVVALVMESSAETVRITFGPSTGTSAVSSGGTSVPANSTAPTTTTTTTTTTATTELGKCVFTSQLASDPVLRAEYTSQISSESLNESQIVDYSGIYESNIVVNIQNPGRIGNRLAIDQLSNNCLSCHDGVLAKDFNVRVKNNPKNRVMSLEDIIGGHPIGMQYKKYVYANPNKYSDDISFSNEMIFAEGKVGCLTCHNPLNEKKGHLTVNNNSSKLCFACHII
jgi:predicted CXXCH cytochrome family protein